jgi:class 3 adenylate cyclase
MRAEVDRRSSLQDWLAHFGGVVGIAFVDIVDSTFVLNSHGTMNYSLVLRAYRSRAVLLATDFNGRLVDSVGDGLCAAFGSATNAYQFASGLFEDPGDPQISVRAGVHFGTVQVLGDGLVGRDMHLAARVIEHAKPRPELWVSDKAKAALEAESLRFASGISWMTSEEIELKGIPNRHRLWRAA